MIEFILSYVPVSDTNKMCQTILMCYNTIVCMFQAIIRMLLTILLMFENLFRMILQSIYNFLSFLFLMFSLIPICCIFIITARFKWLICGGGGCGCGGGGGCNCLIGLLSMVLLYVLLDALGVIDDLMKLLGYSRQK